MLTEPQLAGEIEKRDEDLRQAFLVFDNGSGKGVVDVKTLKHALTTLGDKLTNDEVQAFHLALWAVLTLLSCR